MLASKSVRELVDAFSAPTPTPGGGSAAALAGAMAASLLAMVAGMSKTRTAGDDARRALDAVRLPLLTRRDELMDLMDRDSAAYETVVAAYKLPKTTGEEKSERKAAIARAMRVATDVPMDTARASHALLVHGRIVADHGNPNASSDVGVAQSLARTAFAGARLNVETNLDGVGDESYARAIRSELESLARDL